MMMMLQMLTAMSKVMTTMMMAFGDETCDHDLDCYKGDDHPNNDLFNSK